MSGGGYTINITGHVPDILFYRDGTLFCNDGNGCEVVNADTGEVIETFTTSINIPWQPPAGVTNIGLRLISPSA